MTTLFILIGAPGVGKTVYCSKHMHQKDVRVSMDDLQQMMGGDRYGNYRSELKNTYRSAELAVIKEALLFSHNVWLDRTNMDRQRRQRYIKLAHDMGVSDIIAMNFMAFTRPNDGWLLYRRMQESRGVPETQWKTVIDGMLEAYEPPAVDEGFSMIIDVKLEEVTE